MLRTIALVLGLSAPAHAQNTLAPVAFRDFSGGYVDNVDSINLDPKASPRLLNVVIDEPVGSVKPRRGMVRCGNVPSGNTPTALYEYSKSDGTRRLIVTDNANVYSTPDCQEWTTIVTGLGTSAQPAFATVRDNLWIVNGSTWAQVWDGTTRTPLDGRASTPNPTVPKCAFIEFWKERVWCGAPSGDLSGVAFSALTDSGGNDLSPSTGSLAWPASNNFQIDQNAGSRLNGIKAYKNRLYAFKDNGIWEIGFDNDFSNFVRKTAASIGSRYQTSIAEVDGLLYFTGKDGIYAFDGEQTVRVSAKIENKFRDLNQPLVSQNYKTWTTQADFEGGTFSSATASVLTGSVLISTKPSGLANGNFESGSISPWTCSVSGSSADNRFCGIQSIAQYTPEGVYASSVGFYSGFSMGLYVFKVDGTTVTTDTTFTANVTSTKTIDTAAYQGQAVYLHFYGTTADGGAAHLYSSSFTVLGNITFQYFFNGTAGFYGLDNFQTNQYYSSATWTSDIYNTVAVSTWGAFEANGEENGGTLAYQIRYGTNTGAVQSMAFAAITPGSLIPANTSHIYIQARVILSTTSASTDTPQLDDIQIAWNSGGANTQKIYAAGWKNALWVSASSGTSTSNNMVMTKTKLPLDAWTLSDHQIGPMTSFNDLFYAGASTHSAIYRMDYGTNDDGRAITWYWESKDEVWNMPYNYKQVREMTADFKKGTSASNVKLGYSIDSGVTWSDRTINMSGTGYGTTRQFVNGGLGYSYRFRIFNNSVDESATVTGITGWARANQRRGE